MKIGDLHYKKSRDFKLLKTTSVTFIANRQRVEFLKTCRSFAGKRMEIFQRNQRHFACHVAEGEIFNMLKMFLEQCFKDTSHEKCRKRVR